MSKSKMITAFAASAALALTPAFAADQETADAHFAAGEWAEAASEYEALLATDAENAANWYSLALARRSLEDYEASRDAFQRAIDAGFQPEVRARVGLARVMMALEEQDKALDELEKVAELGGPTHRTLLAIPEFKALSENARYQAVLETLTPCNTEEYRQFDFWLGQWDVTTAGSAQPTASNDISSVQGGCVVLEQYTNAAFTGMSMNFYDSVTGKWHQTWMSNGGGSVYLEGGLTEDGAMQLTDKDLPVSAVTETVNRVTWTPNKDGSVRQHWESSTDDGESWNTVFDGLYTQKTD